MELKEQIANIIPADQKAIEQSIYALKLGSTASYSSSQTGWAVIFFRKVFYYGTKNYGSKTSLFGGSCRR